MECNHCDKQAEWIWSDADGNETRMICHRCMETVEPYMYAPLYHFTTISAGVGAGRRCD